MTKWNLLTIRAEGHSGNCPVPYKELIRYVCRLQFPYYFCCPKTCTYKDFFPPLRNTVVPTKNLLTTNCWYEKKTNESFVDVPAHRQFPLQRTSFGTKKKNKSKCYLIRWLHQAVLPALHFLPGNYFILKVATPSWILPRAVHLSKGFVSVRVCFDRWDQYSLFVRIFHRTHLNKSASHFRFLFTRAYAEM